MGTKNLHQTKQQPFFLFEFGADRTIKTSVQTESKSVVDRVMFFGTVAVSAVLAVAALVLFYDANRLRVAYAQPQALETPEMSDAYRQKQEALLTAKGWADDRTLGGEAGKNKRSEKLGYRKTDIKTAMTAVTKDIQGGTWAPVRLTPEQRDVLDRLDMGGITPEMILAASKNAQEVEAGMALFKANCAACHGAQGNGLVGPNLTDAYWIHGRNAQSVYKVISQGVAAKGMPAWGHLGEDGMKRAAAYVLSIQGKNLPGKAPQGVDDDGNPPPPAS